MKPKVASSFRKSDLVSHPLRQMIRAGEFPVGSRLPGSRELARVFGVSRTAVGAGLKALEIEGLIEVRLGSGVFVRFGSNASQVKEKDAIESTKRRSEQVADLICEEISSGAYKVGETLPLKKTLRYRLHTSSPTLSSALKKVMQKGLVHQKGNAYIVGSTHTKRSRSNRRVHLLATRNTAGEVMRGFPLANDFRFAMGNELSDHGVTYLGWHNKNRRNWESDPQRTAADTLGFVCSVPSVIWSELSPRQGQRLLNKEMIRFNKLGLPVVLFNCSVVFIRHPHTNFRKFPHVFPLGVDNVAAGKGAALHLAMNGHKKVGFFSYSRELWNEPRFRGAIKGIKQSTGGKGTIAGFHAGVNKYSLGQKEGRSHVSAANANELRDLVRSWFPAVPFSNRVSVAEIQGTINEVIVRRHALHMMRPLFEKAYRDETITAWIGADPIVTMHANRFVAEKTQNSSRRISIISIDDSTVLSNQGITACNFNRDRMGYLAAHCLLGDIPIRRDKRGVVECPPKVIERGSVGRV